MNKSIQKIKASIIGFDWGNTLVKDPFDEIVNKIAPNVIKIIKKISPDNKISIKELIKAWKNANSKLHYHFASQFFQDEIYIQKALLDLGINVKHHPFISPEILSLYRQEFRKILQKDEKTKKELKITFEGLIKRGKKIYVLSVDRPISPKSSLEILEMGKYVSGVITPIEVGFEKPNPRFFLEGAKKFGFSVKKMVYIGDDPNKDVSGAKKAGIKAILYIPPKKYRVSKSWRNYDFKVKPDATITNLTELLSIIE